MFIMHPLYRVLREMARGLCIYPIFFKKLFEAFDFGFNQNTSKKPLGGLIDSYDLYHKTMRIEFDNFLG